MGHSAFCDIIGNTCEFVPAPKNSDEWRKISDGFSSLWNFPHRVGAIDGKHIMIQAPANAGSQYYNYKGTHSIVLLAVCDYNYCFTLLDIGDYGRMSDGGVLSNSSFGNAMKTNSLALPNAETVPGIKSPIPYFFVGDQAFHLSTNYLKITEALLPLSSKYYCPSGYIDQEDRQGNVFPGNWRSEGDNRLQSVTQVSSN